MKLPEMFPVQSSNVASVGYNDATQTVFVQFLNGTIYIYKGVTKFEFEKIGRAHV